jgi:hypothetical protein|tara:strand:+ start:1224 stop:1418 length:195 start_codon:yes stop_codon:yes gene_type:complete
MSEFLQEVNFADSYSPLTISVQKLEKFLIEKHGCSVEEAKERLKHNIQDVYDEVEAYEQQVRGV